MYRTFLCALLLLLIPIPLLTQRPDQEMTDKNYREEYAAYLLRGAYGEQGYLGASVRYVQVGSTFQFTVDPGQPYHLGSLTVTGLDAALQKAVLESAPTVGEIYRAARINDWVGDVNKKIEREHLPVKLTRQSGHIDRDHSLVSVTVEYATIQ